jgi:DNA-binding transcriptional ArsR family regulator
LALRAEAPRPLEPLREAADLVAGLRLLDPDRDPDRAEGLLDPLELDREDDLADLLGALPSFGAPPLAERDLLRGLGEVDLALAILVPFVSGNSPPAARATRRAVPLIQAARARTHRLTYSANRICFESMARTATTADAFSAVAEPRRRAILDVLAGGERSVNELVADLGLAQPQVSKHLRVLREVGAVDVREQGRQRLYRLDGRALKPIHDWVKAYERTWSERSEALDVVLGRR